MSKPRTWLGANDRRARLRKIETLDPRKDYREISKLFYEDFGSMAPVPSTLAQMRQLHDRYLNEELAFEPQNLRMTRVLIRFIRALFPALLRPIVAPLLLAQVDPRVLRACGKLPPGRFIGWLSSRVFRLLGKQGPLPDGAPHGLQGLIDQVYPDGYSVHAVGTHVNTLSSR